MVLLSKKKLTVVFLFLVANLSHGQLKRDAKLPYIKTNDGFLMVLREGDNVISAIENLCNEQQIPSGNFTGIGFAGEVTFGFFDYNTKKFNPKTFYKVEMGNLTGSIAWNDDKPSLHIHGIVTDETFNAYGGHILSLQVGTGSMEIYITINRERLERKLEQSLGANVLQVPSVK